MAEYLSADGGQWRASNPNRDPARGNAPPAFGLWFEWLPQHLRLELRIVVHFSDTTRISSTGQFAWHPRDQSVRYGMSGRNGSFTEGTTSFLNSSTFQTFATYHTRNGTATSHRDDNWIVDDSTHRNETLQLDSAGTWQSRGVYTWRRTGSPASDFDLVGETFFAVRVQDADEAATWYGAHLGLHELRRLREPEGRFDIRILSRAGLTVELIEQLGTVEPQAERRAGLFKAGFYVSDIDAAWAHLRTGGVATDPVIVIDETLQARTFILRDLDGNRIQVFQRCASECK